MHNPYKVFHSGRDGLRKQIDVVLVRPEYPGNVGSVARALANMGIDGVLHIVGSPEMLRDASCKRMAVHAFDRLERAHFCNSLAEALGDRSPGKSLALAATARVGSASRPHPLRSRDAIGKAMDKLFQGEVERLFLVFGPEADGLLNEEVDLCDWIVTIPSSPGYRSLNLAQSVLILGYEAQLNLLDDWGRLETQRPGQKARLVQNLIRMAEEVGFVLPGDPYKMKPRLEAILAHLPNHIEDVRTIHGLIDQIVRSVRKGGADMKGRFRHKLEQRGLPQKETDGIPGQQP